MKINLRNEAPLLLLALLPFAYLYLRWNEIPERVPLHWNIHGEADRWGPKGELWMIPLLTCGLIYLILLVVPAIDPKGKIKLMGVKYQQLRYILVGVMSALALAIIYFVAEGGTHITMAILLLIGLLITLLGNYFKTLRPNYFIGIRTPWTLEDPDIWDRTHRLGGVLWFGGGILLMLIAILLRGPIQFYLFMGLTLLLALVPVGYSYGRYRKSKKGGRAES